MKAASAKVRITPDIGFPLGGNVRKDRASRGVHDDLYCNILLLKDESESICILGFDLIGLDYGQCCHIREKISKALNIDRNNIVIFTTHTHSGPDTTMSTYTDMKHMADDYVNGILKEIEAELVCLADKFINVTIKAGKTNVYDLSFNRRLVKKDGTVVMNFEDYDAADIVGTTGPIDPALITLSIWDENQKLYALLVNFTLHPAVLVGYKWLISRDYVNYLDEYIKNTYGKEVVMIFANGAEGNINHINYQLKNQDRGFSEAQRIGNSLGKYVEENLISAKPVEGKMTYASKTITLPLRNITKEEIDWANMVIKRDRDIVADQFDGIPDITYAVSILEMSKIKEPLKETFIAGGRIGQFQFVTLPGEVFTEFGLELKKSMKAGYPAVIGLSNDYIGYIPDRKAFTEGGYEIKTLWTSQLSEDAGELLVKYIKENIIHVLEKEE